MPEYLHEEKDDKYHQLEIEFWGDRLRFQHIRKWIENIMEMLLEEGESHHISVHTNYLAMQIEKQAKDQYIDQMEWSYIVDVIDNNGELHEYHEALGEEASLYIKQPCGECQWSPDEEEE